MKSFKDLKTEVVKSADKKPETYIGPDGKPKIRMVPVDKNVTNEKTLTPAEKKKREEIAKAIEKDNPNMPMDKKMAIATATAKRVAEGPVPGGVPDVVGRITNTKIVKDKNGNEKRVPINKEATDKDYHKTLGPTKNSDEGIAALKKKHGMTHDQAKATIKRLMGETKELDEISVDKMLDYKQRAKYSRDRAANSQAAHSLRGTDPSKDQDTERKRNRGLKTFDKLAARKTRDMLTKKESVNLEEAADDKMKKVKQLAMLGLVDKSDVTKLMKALEDMDAGKTLNVRQKDMLIGTLNDLIGIVTGDTTTFMKAKKAVKEDTQLDEISQKKITNYIGAASDSTKQKTAAMADKRDSGVNLALKKATGKAKVNATENKEKNEIKTFKEIRRISEMAGKTRFDKLVHDGYREEAAKHKDQAKFHSNFAKHHNSQSGEGHKEVAAAHHAAAEEHKKAADSFHQATQTHINPFDRKERRSAEQVASKAHELSKKANSLSDKVTGTNATEQRTKAHLRMAHHTKRARVHTANAKEVMKDHDYHKRNKSHPDLVNAQLNSAEAHKKAAEAHRTAAQAAKHGGEKYKAAADAAVKATNQQEVASDHARAMRKKH